MNPSAAVLPKWYANPSFDTVDLGIYPKWTDYSYKLKHQLWLLLQSTDM